MAQEQPWDQKLMDYLKAAGEELRRTGEELKAESQRAVSYTHLTLPTICSV